MEIEFRKLKNDELLKQIEKYLNREKLNKKMEKFELLLYSLIDKEKINKSLIKNSNPVESTYELIEKIDNLLYSIKKL